jgi:hypothetical protein
MRAAPVTDAAPPIFRPSRLRDPWPGISSALPIDLATLTAYRATLAALIKAIDFDGDDAERFEERRDMIDRRIAQLTPTKATPNKAAPGDGKKVAEAIAAGRHAEATEVLDLLLACFADGAHWTRGRLEDRHGNRCLIGGLQYVQYDHRIDWRSITEAESCLMRALGKRRRDSLIAYNDRSSFAEVRALILKARELAALPDTGKPQSQRRRQPRSRQWQAPAISEGNPLTEPECESLAKLEAAEATKRRLLAEIELEKVARAAIGDTRLTYILRPEPPSNYRVSKVLTPPRGPAKNQSKPHHSPAPAHLCGGAQ